MSKTNGLQRVEFNQAKVIEVGMQSTIHAYPSGLCTAQLPTSAGELPALGLVTRTNLCLAPLLVLGAIFVLALELLVHILPVAILDLVPGPLLVEDVVRCGTKKSQGNGWLHPQTCSCPR